MNNLTATDRVMDDSTQLNGSENMFNIRPAAVKKWVEELPLASTGESSKRLYHALKKVNQQENKLEHQLEFLETITPTLNLLYPRLAKYFTDVSLPLNTKTKNVLHVTNSLLNEMLTGYQTVIKTLLTKKPFGWKKSFSLALHRSFIFSSQVLCTQRLSYQLYGKGIWHRIFWSYQQAEKFNLLRKSYPSFNIADEHTSLEYEFKKLLLLSLLSANDLGQKEMQEIYNLMPLWIKHSEICSKEPSDKKTCFTLNLLSDISPYLLGTLKDKTEQTADRRYLSSTKLKTLLSKYLSNMEDEGAIRIGKNMLSKSTIQSLLSNWSRCHLRSTVRKEGAGFVDIITGISAIHFVLNQQDQPAYDEASVELPDTTIDFESTLTIEPINNLTGNNSLNLEHFLGETDKQEDVWGKVYDNSINESLPAANWTDSGQHKNYTFTKSILLDYSKDGYRLSVNVKKIDSLKNNELVAVREHALAPWALAQVKWVHFSKMGDVQFGLRILTHHVLPTQVSYSANNSFSKPLPCLLALDRKNLMLFVPTLPTDLSGKNLQLEHQKQHSQISLKNKLLSTPAFDAYRILEPKTKHCEEVDMNKSVPPASTKLSDNIWENF